MIKTVGIVGAGFAGVTATKILNSFGFDVTVFEKEATWVAFGQHRGVTRG